MILSRQQNIFVFSVARHITICNNLSRRGREFSGMAAICYVLSIIYVDVDRNSESIQLLLVFVHWMVLVFPTY